MRQKPNLYQFTRIMCNKKYRLGTCDCFSVILDYLSFRKKKIPEEFEGITKETYTTLFNETPSRAKRVMVRFIDSLLEKKAVNFSTPGDLLLVKLKRGMSSISLAIDAGNGNVFCVSAELGVMTVSSRFYNILTCWKI